MHKGSCLTLTLLFCLFAPFKHVSSIQAPPSTQGSTAQGSSPLPESSQPKHWKQSPTPSNPWQYSLAAAQIAHVPQAATGGSGPLSTGCPIRRDHNQVLQLQQCVHSGHTWRLRPSINRLAPSGVTTLKSCSSSNAPWWLLLGSLPFMSASLLYPRYLCAQSGQNILGIFELAMR
eukprot:1146116-Pelagomonas_calceolata.AAC.5